MFFNKYQEVCQIARKFTEKYNAKFKKIKMFVTCSIWSCSHLKSTFDLTPPVQTTEHSRTRHLKLDCTLEGKVVTQNETAAHSVVACRPHSQSPPQRCTSSTSCLCPVLSLWFYLRHFVLLSPGPHCHLLTFSSTRSVSNLFIWSSSCAGLC